ncbi:MAG: hypothetical protein CMC88_03575 [Flavobacteriaceae bacterium]|nr:hypothetical protein [Flavobacteriaceae bacterium]|tara:strand:+ start:18439 stop:19476 length:1038 start_codon:yes stop_codon:yes gene_type:complete
MKLYNKYSAKENAELIKKAGDKRLTLSFYKYVVIKNPKLFRDYLFLNWQPLDVFGRIYVSFEGINAQLSLPSKKLNEFKSQLDEISFLKNIRLNIAIESDDFSFLKLKIKVKSKIVSDGLNDNLFDITDPGKHLDAKKFNLMLNKKETVCIDMRNHYESEIGHFKNAILPNVDTFKESLHVVEKRYSKYKKNKNIVLYCTGGIRCEKASAFLKHKGYSNVFQLEGGIIEYTNQVKKEGIENKFIGKNFVFDQRKAERISKHIISKCHQCGEKSDSHTNCANEACHLLFIQCERCATKMKNCCSNECIKIISLSDQERKELRKGKKNSNKIFKKGRSPVLKFKQQL